MAVIGKHGRLQFGCSGRDLFLMTGNATIYLMTNTTTNGGWCARFTAVDTRDVATIYLNFTAISGPGSFELRIETIDATTGKPTGTLYDASATKTFTPSVGWNTITFATLPTAGLTAGTEYAVVLLKLDATGTATLASHWLPTGGNYPSATLQCADPSTRSNFADVNNGTPVLSMVMEDGAEESLQFMPFDSTTSSHQVYGKIAAGVKFTITTTLVISGVEFLFTSRTGTVSNFVITIYDSANNVLKTQTIDKDSFLSSKNASAWFSTPLTLSPGVYRIVASQSDNTTTSGNRFVVAYNVSRSSANVPSGFIRTSTTDNTLGASISWSDSATDLVGLTLWVDDILPAGGPLVAHGRLVR